MFISRLNQTFQYYLQFYLVHLFLSRFLISNSFNKYEKHQIEGKFLFNKIENDLTKSFNYLNFLL